MLIQKDQAIDDRIVNDIVVDAYDESERAMGWYCYLQDTITFPVKAKCIQSISTSPLVLNQVVEVIGMDSETNCEHDVFVEINWNSKPLCVPLKQLESINADDKTTQAFNDWSYWIAQGYQF